MADLAQLDLRIRSLEAAEATRRLNDLDRAAKQVDASAGSLQRTFSSKGKILQAVGGAFKLLAQQVLLTTGALATFAAAAGAINLVGKFEETLATVQAVFSTSADLTAAEAKRIETTARALGASTRFTAQEVSDAMLLLARAGFNVNQSLAATEPVLRLAQGGMLGMAEAADYLSATIRQFSMEAEDAGRVADVFVAVSNAANTDVNQLAQGMNFAGVAASKMGREFEETAAALAVLADAGIKGSLGGTNLRFVITALLNPTNVTKKALKELGIEVDEVNPQLRSFAEIFERFAQVDPSKLATAAPKVFGVRTFAAGLALTENVKRLKELEDLAKTSEGAAKRMALIIDNTLVGSFLNASSALQELIIAFGRDSGLSEVLKDSMFWLAEMVRSLAGMDASLYGIRPSAAAAAEAIKTLAIAAGVFIGIQLAQHVMSATKAVGLLTSSLKFLGTALLGNPFTAAATAIALAAAALYHYRDSVVSAGEDSTTVGDLVVSVFTNMGERLKIIVELIALSFKRWWAYIQDVSSSVITALGDTFSNFFEDAQEGWVTFTGIFANAFKDSVNFVVALVKSVGETMGLFWGRVVFAIKQVIDLIENPTPVNARNAFSVVKDAFSPKDFWNDVSTAWVKNFEDDFVAKMGIAFSSWAEEYKDNFREGVKALLEDPEFADLAKRWEELGGFSLQGTIDKVFERALERTNSRVDAKLQEFFASVEAGMGGFTKQADAAAEAVEEIGDEFDTLKERAALALRDLIDELRGARDELQYFVREFSRGGNADAIDREIKLLALERKIRGLQRDAGVDPESPEARQQLDNALGDQRQINQLEIMTEQLRELDQIGQDVGRSFGDAFESFVTGAESASEAVKALGRDLLQMSIRKGFTEPLAEGFGSLFRNMFGGAVTSGAAVIPHAQGGVISSPIMFPLNGHRVGVAGEAGPEAIMPLTRGSDGKLGVQASQSGNVAVTNHFHISTPDANSFRRSRNQIAADMRAASRRAAGGL